MSSDQLIIFDMGTGLVPLGNKLMTEHNSPKTSHIFISHFHWDHISGLPFFTPAFIPKYNISFFGPGDSKEKVKKLTRKRG